MQEKIDIVKERLVKNCGYNDASAFSSQEMHWEGPVGDYLSMV